MHDMIQRSRPFSDKFLRYILSCLIFVSLGLFLLWQGSWWYGTGSIVLAFLLSFGIDILFRFIVRKKVLGIVKEEPHLIIDAIRLKSQKRGYLVVTDRFFLFVPLFRKVKTVVETNQIVRIESERVFLEVTAKFPNQFRTFSYTVLSTKKLLPVLQKLTGESLPYKYDKLEKMSSFRSSTHE